jgi:2-hydroxychromene-2-carboxylate isomerase
MTLEFEVYWSFRSPYSYPVTPRLVALAQEFQVRPQIRIVRPLAIRTPDHFTRMDPMWRPYLFLDTKRMADYLGLPFQRPVPDPIIQDPRTNKIAAEQPYIRRLCHRGLAANHAGQGLAYIDRISRMLWGGEVEGWDQGDHLARAAADLGLDHAAMQAEIDADPERFDDELLENEAAEREAGHWGVPAFTFNGEPFFGQDRFEIFVWRLKQAGLELREEFKA